MFRNNPKIDVGELWDFGKNAPLFFTGGLAAVAASVAPPLIAPTLGLGAGPGTKYAVQAGVALGGGWLIDQMMGAKSGHGVVWMLVGSAVIIADVLNTYVLRGMLGLADYEVSDYQLGAYPFDQDELGDAEDGVGAYPEIEAMSSELPGTVDGYDFNPDSLSYSTTG